MEAAVAHRLYKNTADLAPEIRKSIADGIISPVPITLLPPLRLCRLVDRQRRYEGAVAPWWIAEGDLSTIFQTREASRSAHGGDTKKGLSLGIIARSALGIPQTWRDGTRTTLDMLLQADLKMRGVLAYVGKGRAQRETAPNGITLEWSPWSSITQIYIPALARTKHHQPTLEDVESIMTLGAARYFVSRPVY
jgi:hypothetical protein